MEAYVKFQALCSRPLIKELLLSIENMIEIMLCKTRLFSFFYTVWLFGYEFFKHWATMHLQFKNIIMMILNRWFI